MVRVRFAPSPTGIPHLGNTRTALFNYLFAKKKKGKFILRIEDTDRERLIPESLPKILQILKIVGISWDEGPQIGGPFAPYIQSKRLSIYKKLAHQLVDQRKAYFCFCSKKRLEAMRKEQQKKGFLPRYDRKCLTLPKKTIEEKLAKKEKYVIRLKILNDKKILWDDLIMGKISFSSCNLDDQVLLKSDGYPTYHLAVVIDDHLMKITHILRGAEWISSVPKHILLYQAFGWPTPAMGHFPIILGPDKGKLSKRHGAKSALDYTKEGYLPEALVNFMAFLGWSYKDNSDLLSIDDLIKLFDLKRIGKANPIFDIKKLDWFNSCWIRRKTNQELIKLVKPFLEWKIEDKKLKKIIPLVKERLVKLTDINERVEFFVKEINYPAKLLLQKGATKTLIKKQLTISNQQLTILKYWNKEPLEKLFRDLVNKNGWDTHQFFMTIRVAVTSQTATPPLFETMGVLGREKTCERIKKAIIKL